MPFKPGEGGRPKGAKNRATNEFKAFWQKFYASKAYRVSAQERILAGKAPHLESYTLNALYGRPVERHELTGDEGGPVLVKFIEA